MRNLRIKVAPLLFLVISLHVMSCGGSSGDSNNTVMVDEGSWYVTGFTWPHDGNPFESDNFTIYSDGASSDARQALAQLAEDTLDEITVSFGIQSSDIFQYPPGQDGIDIYAYKNRYPPSWGGWAYYGGLLIFSLDHPERTSFGHTAPHIYIPTLKHEITHVVESLLKASNNPNLVDVWLTEGLAEAVSGGTAGGSITGLAKMNELIQTYGSLNPIAMHQYNYPDVELIVYYYYYPMFQLAVEYLIDANGHGKTLNDFTNLFLDVRNGVPFPIAFNNRIGISLAQYESQFFNLMNNYLQ